MAVCQVSLWSKSVVSVSPVLCVESEGMTAMVYTELSLRPAHVFGAN